MGKIIVDFNKFYSLANECGRSADAYRDYISQLKAVVASLGSMQEPSLGTGIEHINELINDMNTSASDLDAIEKRLNTNLAMLKKIQDEVEKAAKNLTGGN